MELEPSSKQAKHLKKKTVNKVDRMEVEQEQIKAFTQTSDSDSSSESESESSSLGSSGPEVTEEARLTMKRISRLIKKSHAEQFERFVPAFCKEFLNSHMLAHQTVAPRPVAVTFEPLPGHFPPRFVKKKLHAQKWMGKWLKKQCVISKHPIKKKGKGRKGTNPPAPFKNYEVLIWPSIWPPEPHSVACKKLRTFQAGSRGHRYIRCLAVDVKKQNAFLSDFKKVEKENSPPSPVSKKILSKH